MTLSDQYHIDEVPIILVDRGNCSFVTKVKNVQEAGGHIALIVNNNPIESIEDIIMADDGRGRDLVIPGVLITSQQGEILKNFYKENKSNKKLIDNIKIEVDFEMENRTNNVKLDFYISSKNENFYKLINEISSHLLVLKDSLDLNINYISHQSFIYSANSLRDIPECYGSGLHCHHPGNFKVGDARIFVEEDIKQKCILNYAKESNNINIFLDYVNNFYRECVNVTNNFNAECSAIVCEKNNIPLSTINKCVHDSFDIDKLKNSDENIKQNYKLYAPNKLLKEDLQKKEDNLISFLPAILINNRNFWGSWTLENLFEGICSAYKKKPQICYDEGYFNKPSTISNLSLFLLILLVIAVNIGIFLICRNLIRKRIVERIESTDINHKINTIVTSYLALREAK